MSRILPLPLLSIVLVAGLTFPPLAAYTTVYAELSGLVIALVLLSQRNWDVFGVPTFKLVWLSVLALCVALPFSMKGIEDFYGFVALLPVFLAPAVVMLFRENPSFAHPQVIGCLCLAGSVGAVVTGLNDIYVLNLGRAGGGNNAIHFGDLSLILGFFSLVGLFGSRSAWRFIFLSGPVLGFAAALLSASRGPFVGAVVLAFILIPILVVWFRREFVFRIVMVAGLAGLVVVATQVDIAQIERATFAIEDIAKLTSGEGTTDEGIKERFIMYRAAVEAFKLAPIFGHGSGHIAAATNGLIPDTYAHLRNAAHLHNDIADFAVIGGLAGLLAYVFLLAAPFAALWHGANGDTRRAVFVGAIVLSVGYFTLGLTNAMFGILPQTALYGLLLGIIVAMAETSNEGD